MKLDYNSFIPSDVVTYAIKKQCDLKRNFRICKEPGDAIKYYGSSYAFSRIFNAILSNAIRFTKNDGTIIVTIKEENEHLVLIVEDDGCGIKSDMLSQITDGLQELTVKETGGIGVGLSLVGMMARAVRATVDITSKSGTTVCVTFPYPPTYVPLRRESCRGDVRVKLSDPLEREMVIKYAQFNGYTVSDKSDRVFTDDENEANPFVLVAKTFDRNLCDISRKVAFRPISPRFLWQVFSRYDKNDTFHDLGLSIILVEDNAARQAIFTHQLNEAGCSVTVIPRITHELATMLIKNYDLVIADERVNGIEKFEDYASWILVLTSVAEKPCRGKYIYAVKPIVYKILLQILGYIKRNLGKIDSREMDLV